MYDWEWDDMAMAGLFGEMMADEELERLLAERENEPMTQEEETPFDYLDEEEQTEIKRGAWFGHPLFT